MTPITTSCAISRRTRPGPNCSRTPSPDAAALAETGKVQARVRDLPSRVVVYLLLVAGLFAELGYGQVWRRLVAGLDGLAVATPTAGALAQARRRIGVAPLRALLDPPRGPGAGLATKGVYWRGRW